jgi:hypothetical protein
VGFVLAKAENLVPTINQVETEYDNSTELQLKEATRNPADDEPLSIQEKIQQLMSEDPEVSGPSQEAGQRLTKVHTRQQSPFLPCLPLTQLCPH